MTVFRTARPRATGAYLLLTAAQCVAVWGLTLVVGPLIIITLERRLGVPGFAFPAQSLIASSVFIAASALNLATGCILASRGLGTPLPLASPRRLVLAGPYRWVRNPMAIAGIGQGIGVALWLGSWSVLLYAFAGAVLWQFAARPAEEEDLSRRFGEEYDHYRSRVPLWLPRSPKPDRGP